MSINVPMRVPPIPTDPMRVAGAAVLSRMNDKAYPVTFVAGLVYEEMLRAHVLTEPRAPDDWSGY